MKRIFAGVPNVAFVRIVAMFPDRGRYVTIADQYYDLINYTHYAAANN